MTTRISSPLNLIFWEVDEGGEVMEFASDGCLPGCGSSMLPDGGALGPTLLTGPAEERRGGAAAQRLAAHPGEGALLRSETAPGSGSCRDVAPPKA